MIMRHRDTVNAGLARNAVHFFRMARIERGLIQIEARRATLVGEEIDEAALLIHATDCAFPKIRDIPAACGQLALEATIGRVKIQVLITVSVRSPDELSGLADER